MTRAEFMGRLRRGLVGMPAAAAADIAADYEIHFEDGLAAGRSEAEVASALGDPDRLARELRAEAGAQRWHQEKNPSAAVAAIFAVLGLGCAAHRGGRADAVLRHRAVDDGIDLWPASRPARDT
jgi:uncharacterized membrane protein